jgi:hypothetical protein
MFAACRQKMQEEEARVFKNARQMKKPANLTFSQNEESNKSPVATPYAMAPTQQVYHKQIQEYQYTSEDIYNFILDEMADPLTWSSHGGLSTISVWVYHTINNSIFVEAVEKLTKNNAFRGCPWKIQHRTEPDHTRWVDFEENIFKSNLSCVSKLTK